MKVKPSERWTHGVLFAVFLLLGLILFLSWQPARAADLAAFGAGAGSISGSPQVMIYRGEGTQLPIVLPLSETRLVHFPTSVQLVMPQGAPLGVTQTINSNTIYWQAEKPFAPVAMMAQSLETDAVYHLLVSANPGAPSTPLQIMDLVEADPAEASRPEPWLDSAPVPATFEEDVQPAAESPGEPELVIGYTALLRHAAQTLYAPNRLKPRGSPIAFVPIATEPITLIRSGKARAATHAQWRYRGLSITAVVLKNQLSQRLWVDTAEPAPPGVAVLEDQDIRGNWRVYGFQHPELAPRGTIGRNGEPLDVTTLYLIHTAELRETLEYQP